MRIAAHEPPPPSRPDRPSSLRARRLADWHLAAHKEDAFAAQDDLRKLYPKIPVGYPEGSNTEEVNYAHLLIVAMEWRADGDLMGELKAREVMSFWADDHYTWIYREVMAHPEVVDRVIKAHHLAP